MGKWQKNWQKKIIEEIKERESFTPSFIKIKNILSLQKFTTYTIENQ